MAAQILILGAGGQFPATPCMTAASSPTSSGMMSPCPPCRPCGLALRVQRRARGGVRTATVTAAAAAAASSPAESESIPSSSNTPATEDIPPAAPATSSSLVARTPDVLKLEEAGAAELAQVNHYEILRVPFGSSTADIIKAFKDRSEEVRSRQNEENEQESTEQLRILRNSFELLTSDEERKVYDWVLLRYRNRAKDVYIWPYQTDITQRYSNEEPVPVMRSFDDEGTNRLGLVLLGFVALSVILSTTMKTWIPYHHYAEQVSGYTGFSF